MSSTDRLAKVIWDYMLLHHQLRVSDAILVLGSVDDRVPAYAADLFMNGYGKIIIITGGSAHDSDLLATSWKEPTEAEHFAYIIQDLGVSSEKIILEKRATNTGENVRFTQQLLDDKGIQIASLILVQKPYMERRAYATFKKQWVGDIEISVTSPPISFEEYFDEQNRKDKIINIMVGDLQRIKEYPLLGYQIKQDIPRDVWKAWEVLVEKGYGQHLLKNASTMPNTVNS